MASTAPQVMRLRSWEPAQLTAWLGLMLTAVLLALAFPRPGWWPLAHVALAPAALVTLRSARLWRLAWASWLVGVVWWLWMARWMIPVTVGGWIGMSLYLGLHWAAALAALRVLWRRWHVPVTLALPAVWVSLEMVRSHFPAGGFGWFALGHSQAAWRVGDAAPRLAQSADLFGELTVSLLVAMGSGLVVDVLSRPWFVSRGSRAVFSRSLLAAMVTWGLLVGAALAYGGYHERQWRDRFTDWPTLRVGLVQTNVPQTNKQTPTPQSERHDWQRLLEVTGGLLEAADPPAVVVWPETVVPAPLDGDSLRYYQPQGFASSADLHSDIQGLAVGHDVHLLVGASALEWEAVRGRDGREYVQPASGRRFNSVFHYLPTGRPADVRYDKVHRVPFGEYIPWVDAWPWAKQRFITWFSPYNFDYTLAAGSRYTVFEIPGPQTGPAVRLATPICFEDAIARVCRAMVYGRDGRKRADALVNLTNDGWYAGWDQQIQHLQLASLRAIELRVPMARAVNTGVSGVIDSLGRIGPVVSVNGHMQAVEGTMAADLRLDRRTTLFGRWGERPMWLLTLVTAAAVMTAAIGPRRQAGALKHQPADSTSGRST